MQDKYLREHEAAEIMNCSVQTLRNHRTTRRGVDYIKNGKTVLYSLKDIHDYMNKNKILYKMPD